jgi:hypothetical protein
VKDLEDEIRGQPAAGALGAKAAPASGAEAAPALARAGAGAVVLSAAATVVPRAEGPARCSGTLADLAVADVLQLLQLIGKSAVMTVTVEHGGAQSRLWCNEGSLIDAESGRLRGEAAAYRILALDDGWLEAELRHEQRPRTIDAPTQRLLLEAARRKDETLGLKRRLGDERCCYRLVHEPEAEHLGSLSAAEVRLLRVLASAPSVVELLAESDLGDLETLVLLERWFDAGYLAQVGPRPEPPAGHHATEAALFASDPARFAADATELATGAARSGGPPHVLTACSRTAGVSPRSAGHSPVREPRWSAAAVGAALLALASFAGGYVLRGSTGVWLASPSRPQSSIQGLEARSLDQRRSDAELHTAEATRNEQADIAAPAKQGVPEEAIAAANGDESPAPQELAADPEAGISADSVSPPAAAPSNGPGLSARAAKARNKPSEAGRSTSRPPPTLSEPRVRVIGATEPSVRLLD